MCVQVLEAQRGCACKCSRRSADVRARARGWAHEYLPTCDARVEIGRVAEEEGEEGGEPVLERRDRRALEEMGKEGDEGRVDEEGGEAAARAQILKVEQGVTPAAGGIMG